MAVSPSTIFTPTLSVVDNWPGRRVKALLSTLNAAQRAAVQHTGSPLLILAGAGSGKTRVITVKIAYCIEHLGIDPRSILAVTFTNKAAGEMRERAQKLSPAAADVMIRTFHSFGVWLLRRNAHLLGMPSRFSVYDEDDSVALLRSVFPDDPRPTALAYARAISRAKDLNLDPDDDLSPVTVDRRFPDVYQRYEQRLRAIGNADFGDLIRLPCRMLADDADLRRRVRSRFRVILVDEYQDSNTAQYDLLAQLYDESAYICVVGDDDQSIYRFRGAQVRNILTFPERFPGTTIVKLEQNYRSTNPILHLASAVVAHNTNRLGKTLFTERAGGRKPQLVLLADQDHEVQYCIGVVQRGALSETAILYRTNAQSRLFETTFLREGIPYRVVGTLRFYDREEVKDVVAWLKFVVNERDEIAFRRIINKPTRGIGAGSVTKILEYLPQAHGDVLEAMRLCLPNLAKKAATAVRAFLQIAAQLRADVADSAAAQRRLTSFVERVVQASGLAAYYIAKDETTGPQKIENIEELANSAGLYPASLDGLVDFLESIELDSGRETDETAESAPVDRVTLITMHNTKGLEFDRVVVTGLEDGLFPRAGRGADGVGGYVDEAEVEEERRLFYVAITRARNELFVTSCGSRQVHGRFVALEPSRFLREIPGDLVEIEDRRGGVPAGYGGSNAASYHDGFGVGARVYHDEYGAGVVAARRALNGPDVVTVQFESGMNAQFVLKYSGLERISDD